MNPEKYLHPSKDPAVVPLNKAIVKACANPNQLVRVSAGWYLIQVRGELIDIEKQGNEWVCREYTYKWVGEPFATLNYLVEKILEGG